MSAKKPYRFWTVADLRYLKKWYGIKPVREIAAHLGRTETATHTMADKHGISGRGMRVDTKKHCRNKMRSLIMHGMSSYEIAREMGTDSAHISKVVKREMPPEFRNQLLANGRRAHRDAIKRRQAKARRRHGSPCRICGNTERYVSTGVCTNRANHGPRWSITSERKQMLETRRKERLQNHSISDISTRHYDRYNMIREKREAMDVWNDYVVRMLEKHTAPVSVRTPRAHSAGAPGSLLGPASSPV